MINPTLWTKAYIWGWVAILAILFGYELYAVIFGNKHDPPLTWVTVKYAPWFVTMPFLSWLWLHFFLRYTNPKYIGN